MTGLQDMQISGAAISLQAMMLMGFQRTKQISAKARKAWEAGDASVMEAEVAARRDEIFQRTLEEVFTEYTPLRAALRAAKRSPKSVIDIGCGQALNDAFLVKDFGCAVTLVDIEQTPEQYHSWNGTGSGYASLADAVAFLKSNGATLVTPINPLKTPDKMNGLKADLVTSLISCGFHYPIGDYADLMVETVEAGGAVVLDLRRRYHDQPDEALTRLIACSQQTEIESPEKKARRILFQR